METQAHKNTKIYVGTLSPRREKPGDKFQIISLYQIVITTLIDTTWVKKNSVFLFTHYSLPHFVFSLTLSIFFFSFACSYSRNSSRLHQSSTSLAGTSLFSGASHPHPLGSSLLQPIFTGRMASLFISSSFPSFLPFTLFISSHKKCKPLTLTLLQPKSLSSGLIGRMALLVSFLSSFTSVSQV